ncbi:vacuolar protein sorting-associated protein 37B isoform X2 [Strongylocentrotus purpuratus]|nr:vacuolar protein sorting-associated protein 37B isoform X2 [Strongylocentrotus purpuratus]|eukprot:XP_797017.2 PREDICTED: vacuolar protein sorting-associated protein 37B isoform X2 [Strongylocentrotus purpuratus]
MYSSHSYPYAFNQSPHQTPPRHTPPQAHMPMPNPPQSQPNLSYPHPTSSSYPASSSYPTPPTSSPQAPMAAAVGAPGASRGSSEFPLLAHLSVDELQRLLSCEDKLNDIAADDANQNKQRRVDKEMAMAENRSLADHNLSRETRLREGRNQLGRLHEEAKSIRDVYDVDRRRLESLNENFSLDAAKVMLETSATKTEEESEEIAEEFLNGNLPISDFVEQFMQRRMMAHVRRIKSDKMQELLRKPSYPALPQNVDIPMTTPMGYTPMPARPAPGVPPATGNQMPSYYPGHPAHIPAPAPAPVAYSGSPWAAYQSTPNMPSLPAFPR